MRIEQRVCARDSPPNIRDWTKYTASPIIPVPTESAETWVAACLLSDESHLMWCNRWCWCVFPKKVEKRLQVFWPEAKTKLQHLFI